MHRIRTVAVALVLGSILAAGGCVAVPGGYYGEGYPPYGERYVTPEGLDVVYDYGPGAYGVVGQPGIYWWDGYYYRRQGGHWEQSHHYRGPWAYRPVAQVPFVAHKGGNGPGHAPGGAWGHTNGPAPGRPPPGQYGNPGWTANRGSDVQRNNQFGAVQNPQRGTAPTTFDAARRAQAAQQQQQAWAHLQAQQPHGGTPFPTWDATRRGQTHNVQPPPNQQPDGHRMQAQNQRRYVPGSPPPNTASGKVQHAPKGHRPYCPPGKTCETKNSSQR
jgi:hypothetical protein